MRTKRSAAQQTTSKAEVPKARADSKSRLRFPLALLLLLVVVVAIVFVVNLRPTERVKTGQPEQPKKVAVDNPEQYSRINQSPYYDQAGFGTTKDGRACYHGKRGSTYKVGVDVSDLQDSIDWQRVKEDGISFAMIRIGLRGTKEGNVTPDNEFENNFKGAQEAGIKCGVYFFSQALNEKEAIEEADLVLKLLNGRKLDYPVAFDHESISEEYRTYGNDPAENAKAARAFCKRIERAGYDTVIYGNYVDLNSVLKGEELQDYKTWFAEYGASPSISHECLLWQFTSEGEVDGINTDVDLNLDMTPIN